MLTLESTYSRKQGVWKVFEVVGSQGQAVTVVLLMMRGFLSNQNRCHIVRLPWRKSFREEVCNCAMSNKLGRFDYLDNFRSICACSFWNFYAAQNNFWELNYVLGLICLKNCSCSNRQQVQKKRKLWYDAGGFKSVVILFPLPPHGYLMILNCILGIEIVKAII